MSDVRDIVSRIFLAKGAVVERIEPGGLELLAPPRLQKALELPEFSRLGFGPELPDQAVRISLESDWMSKLDALMCECGSLLSIVAQLDNSGNRPSHPERLLEKHIVFENATHRLMGIEPAWTRYLLLVFQFTAISDEKREDILSVCLNESNGAYADHLTDPLLVHLQFHRDSASAMSTDAELAVPWSEKQIQDWCIRFLPTRVRTRLSPFLAGMERRMSKDMDRLYTYHSDLRNEAAARIEENKKKENPDSASTRREQMRIEAIGRDYHAKIADLRRKYAMTIEVKLVQVLRMAMPVYRIQTLVLRRKGKRHYHLDWNALSKQLDILPCEGCGASSKTHAVCDDQLHIICPDCMAACNSCRKQYCRACHPLKCPHCGMRPALQACCIK